MTQQESHAAAEQVSQRRGLNVIGALAVLTVLEFIVAVAMDGGNWLATILGVVAAIKAALIIQYFMHFHQMWDWVSETWGAIITGEDSEPETHD